MARAGHTSVSPPVEHEDRVEDQSNSGNNKNSSNGRVDSSEALDDSGHQTMCECNLEAKK